MKFYDQFSNKPPADEETNSGESLVEAAGYIPAEVQIMEMIQAGERLGEYRKERYDFESIEKDDGTVDPTRRLDYDLADASKDLAISDRNLRISAENAKKAADEAVKEVKEKENENGVP